jgi:hypothetical protein
MTDLRGRWHHCVSEFDNIHDLNKWLREWSMYEQDGSVEIKKIYRSADKAYFVWWLSDK